MTLHQLKVFLAIARHSSITKASQELHISEPSVHQQVKSLQMNFSRSLYQKVGRVIEITSDGRAFSAKATEILRKVEELERQFGQTLAANCPAHLAVGGSHVLSASVLAPVVATFKTRYPDVEIEFRTKSGPFIERLVLSEKIDVGLVVNEFSVIANCWAVWLPGNGGNRLQAIRSLQKTEVDDGRIGASSFNR
jgi:DNA-binding transcriptional LysR family regulator